MEANITRDGDYSRRNQGRLRSLPIYNATAEDNLNFVDRQTEKITQEKELKIIRQMKLMLKPT